MIKCLVMILLFVSSVAVAVPRVERSTIGVVNNNPGNVKKPGADTWLGSVGYDRYGHVIFVDRQHGVRALYKNFLNRARRCPDMTLYTYFSYVYAEENGAEEARFVAAELGVSVNTKLRSVNLVRMVVACAWFESNMVLSEEEVREVIRTFNLEVRVR